MDGQNLATAVVATETKEVKENFMSKHTNGVVVAVKALPGDGPATTLISQVISMCSRNKDLPCFLRQRKQRFSTWLTILKQHQRLPHCFTS